MSREDFDKNINFDEDIIELKNQLKRIIKIIFLKF